MPPIPPQQVQMTCPNCRTPFRAAIYTVIDAPNQPQLKQALLAGQLNMAVCPNCGMASLLGAPLIYHDAGKQLMLIYIPQELGLRPEEQERFIGDVTSLLMRDLAPDAARGYLLAPKRFLSLGTLVDTVLEADGIPREVLEAQRRRVQLIGRLVEAGNDDARLAELVAQHRAELDTEFFDTLLALAQANPQAGRDEQGFSLQELASKLMGMVGYSDPHAELSDEQLATLIDRMVAASESELELLIGESRPLIDYAFFEALTARLEAAEAAGDTPLAEQLAARRSLLLETVERMDQQAQQMFESGAAILREVFEAPDSRQALRERAEQLDEAFMLVLQANIAAAERAGNMEAVERLNRLNQLAVEVIQERMTPEERLVNQLLTAETPQESTRILRQNAGQVTAAFVKRVNELADEMEKNGRKELSQRLRQISREAGAMLF